MEFTGERHRHLKAIILAGGKGTRLKPYTYVLPKPLAPVGERPILAILIGQLKKAGIRDFVFCVNHMAELIMAYFGTGEKFGVRIEYSMEDTPLGTIAPLKLIKDLPTDFLVMNGDLLTDMNFMDIYDYHLNARALVTVGAYRRKVNIDFGVMEVKDDMVTGFREKPQQNYCVSMGVYVFNKKVLDYVPDSRAFGFDDLMLKLLQENQAINSYPFSGYWLDIGRPEDFDQANQDIEAGLFGL
ncbi:MAG TPA: sugar phosphate nucleotidyltransferase [Candidatus Deferrimicrobium sp.]|nr:sugar phosphate nucleotidyltransferase [Candidatus Deferrimicrobium sp.]